MGGYNSSDDEREEGGADRHGGQQASTPPEYRFLAAGRRSLMEYLLSTSSTGSTGSTGSTTGRAAAGGASASESAAAAAVAPVESMRPPAPPAMVGGSGSSSGSGSVADSASFERIEHEHANAASSSSPSFVPDSFASLGSFLFQRDVSLGGSSMVSSLSASVLHPHTHQAATPRSPSPAIDEDNEAAAASLAGSAFTQIHAEDALPDTTLSTSSASAVPASTAASSSSSRGFRVLDKALKGLLKPQNFFVALLVAMNVHWRLKLTVEERRAGRWESRALGEEGRRVEAEAELARTLDRLEEVLGALQACEAEQAAWRAQRARGVVVGGGEGVRVQLGDGYAPVRRSVQNHSNSNGDLQHAGPDSNRVRVAAREAAANNNDGQDYCSTKPAAPKEEQPQQPRHRHNNNNNDHREEGDNRQQGRGGSSSTTTTTTTTNNNNNNDNGPAEDESPPAFTCLPKRGAAASDPPSLTLLDTCFVQMRVQGGPCSEEALQALTEGLGHALHTGQATVQEVVKGTVGLAQGLLGSLEGLVDDAAAAASSLSLDALADVLGVGGAGAWFDEDE